MSRPGLSPTDYVEEVEFLTSCGMSTREIPVRLGRTASAVAMGLRRAGRPDLARPFDVLRNHERAEDIRPPCPHINHAAMEAS